MYLRTIFFFFTQVAIASHHPLLTVQNDVYQLNEKFLKHHDSVVHMAEASYEVSGLFQADLTNSLLTHLSYKPTVPRPDYWDLVRKFEIEYENILATQQLNRFPICENLLRQAQEHEHCGEAKLYPIFGRNGTGNRKAGLPALALVIKPKEDATPQEKHNNSLIIIAYAGSLTQADWDVNAQPYHPKSKIFDHYGYTMKALASWESLSQRLFPLLQEDPEWAKDVTIILTGHSQGAALATLTAKTMIEIFDQHPELLQERAPFCNAARNRIFLNMYSAPRVIGGNKKNEHEGPEKFAEDFHLDFGRSNIIRHNVYADIFPSLALKDFFLLTPIMAAFGSRGSGFASVGHLALQGWKWSHKRNLALQVRQVGIAMVMLRRELADPHNIGIATMGSALLQVATSLPHKALQLLGGVAYTLVAPTHLIGPYGFRKRMLRPIEDLPHLLAKGAAHQKG